ncbi:hypothetical protein BV22DRAFT_627439 [Leucogyrophana mollusca]|uniref:Uncharacterized protein n=1 Tax=Leucogyrophana mollusca TaxID=85980 RepID=A0ACB8BBN3_9AGAM|nr:hypothetical protein BV22DRAFT_627439 [Leucogyrophana mollusca]
MSAPRPDHYRMHLNNYLQQRYGHTQFLTWEHSHQGPLHQPMWFSTAYLEGIPWGNGQGPSRGAAMEMAASEVLRALATRR